MALMTTNWAAHGIYWSGGEGDPLDIINTHPKEN
jgi:hypothetical protein